MLEIFYPNHEAASAYEIPYKALYEKGCRGVIFDIDNTLVEHGAPADDRAIALCRSLREMGYRIVLLSNNKESRVKSFSDSVQAQYIFKAGKPKCAGYERAMELMKTTRENTIFVGDQLFTDVWGAKRAGLDNYLVRPIAPKEEIQIVLKRYLEKVVLWSYHRQKKKHP